MKSTGAFITGLIVGMGSRKWAPITSQYPHWQCGGQGFESVSPPLKNCTPKELCPSGEFRFPASSLLISFPSKSHALAESTAL